MSRRVMIVNPRPQVLTAVLREEVGEVVLHNDQTNTMEHVVGVLARVFGHSRDLAVKVMLEAHRTGRAVAEVEGLGSAILHRDQLGAQGLSATVERI